MNIWSIGVEGVLVFNSAHVIADDHIPIITGTLIALNVQSTPNHTHMNSKSRNGHKLDQKQAYGIVHVLDVYYNVLGAQATRAKPDQHCRDPGALSYSRPAPL